MQLTQAINIKIMNATGTIDDFVDMVGGKQMIEAFLVARRRQRGDNKSFKCAVIRRFGLGYRPFQFRDDTLTVVPRAHRDNNNVVRFSEKSGSN